MKLAIHFILSLILAVSAIIFLGNLFIVTGNKLNKETLPERYITPRGSICYIMEKCKGLPANHSDANKCYVCTR